MFQGKLTIVSENPVIQVSVVEAVLNHPLPYPMEMITQPMSISHTPENSSRSINEFSRTINKLFLRSGEETTVPIDYVPLLSTTKRYVARQSHVCLELWILDYHVMNFHLAVSKVLLTLLFQITSAPTTSLGRISDYLGEICIQLFKVQITRIS